MSDIDIGLVEDNLSDLAWCQPEPVVCEGIYQRTTAEGGEWTVCGTCGVESNSAPGLKCGSLHVLESIHKLLSDDDLEEETLHGERCNEYGIIWGHGYLHGITQALDVTSLEYIDRRLAEKQA
jgi:hypothetical protein